MTLCEEMPAAADFDELERRIGIVSTMTFVRHGQLDDTFAIEKFPESERQAHLYGNAGPHHRQRHTQRTGTSYRYSPWVFLISRITKEDRMDPMASEAPRTLMMKSL